MVTTTTMPPTPTLRMSREEYYRRYNESAEHVELIEGQVYQMTPAGPRHVTVVSRLRRALEKQLDDAQHVLRQESQIVLPGNSDPEPDLAIVRGPESLYEQAHPSAQDVLLAIEVSESTLGYDRNTKLPLYAAHRIPEVWIINLIGRYVEIYRRPDASARRYLQESKVVSGLVPDPEHLPGVSVPFTDIFPATSTQ